MSDQELTLVMKRLDALERRMIVKSPVADPAPDDITNNWKWDFYKRLDWIEKLVSELVPQLKGPPGGLSTDPPPDDIVRYKGQFVQSRLAELVKINPGWFTDPPPDDFLNVKVIDLIRRFRGGFTDPAPEELGKIHLKDLLQRIPGGGFTDPSPEEIGKLTFNELETQIHKIGVEMVRLKSLERLMQDRLQQVRSGK